jgi:hypothetical protein
MVNSASSDAAPAIHRRWLLPSWLASLVLHMALCLLLALAWQSRRSLGIVGEGGELTGRFMEGVAGDYYDSPGDGQEEGARPSLPESVFVETVLGGPPGVKPSGVLAGPGPGAGGAADGGGSESLFIGESGRGTGNSGSGRGSGSGTGGMLGGGSQPRAGSGRGTKTGFFIEDQGNSFVFVIDRSASMSQSGRLAAAKAELLSALKNLTRTNQFHIIFYNDKSEIFRPQGDRAFTADDPTKRLAERFIGSITADGPTDGFAQALRMAVSFHPDVIYFLTDAEDISLSDLELAAFSRASYGTTIHAIKFGEGAEERIPWMLKLAKDNGGKYLYVDSRGFSERK